MAEIVSIREQSNKSDGTVSLGEFLKLEERPENEINNIIKVNEMPVIEVTTNILSPNIEK